MTRTDRVHTFVAKIVRSSDKALKIDCDETEEQFWLPKSMILEPDASTLSVGDQEEITIPYWLAQEKGIV